MSIGTWAKLIRAGPLAAHALVGDRLVAEVSAGPARPCRGRGCRRPARRRSAWCRRRARRSSAVAAASIPMSYLALWRDLQHRGVGQHRPQPLDHASAASWPGAPLARTRRRGRAAGRSPRPRLDGEARRRPAGARASVERGGLGVERSRPSSTARARIGVEGRPRSVHRDPAPLGRLRGAAARGAAPRPRPPPPARSGPRASWKPFSWQELRAAAAGRAACRRSSSSGRAAAHRRVEADQAGRRAAPARRSAISASRRFGCLIASALASRPSRSRTREQLGRGLGADPGHARHVVGGVADQRQRVAAPAPARRRTSRSPRRAPIGFCFIGSHICDPVARPAASGPCRRRRSVTSLAGGARRPGVGGDQVVGLEALQLDRPAGRRRARPRAPGRTAASARAAARRGCAL